MFLVPTERNNPNVKFAVSTYIIVFLNIILFIVTYYFLDFNRIVMEYGFTPSKISVVTLIASLFLHGSILHILGNMYYLVMFGNNVEDMLTWKLFVPVYIVCGVGANLIEYYYTSVPNIPGIGASGAISGIMGIYMVFFPNASFYISFGANYSYGKIKSNTLAAVGVWFLMQFIFYIYQQADKSNQDNIAYIAHIGGFITGYAIGWILKATSVDEKYYKTYGLERANLIKQNEKELIEEEKSDKTLFNIDSSKETLPKTNLLKKEYICQYCGDIIILNDKEIREKSYICPSCDNVNTKILKKLIIIGGKETNEYKCQYCNSSVRLRQKAIDSKLFICPVCKMENKELSRDTNINLSKNKNVKTGNTKRGRT